jgi:methanogenic corrinoid protein MtbC1
VNAALATGPAPETILKDGLLAALGEVGRLFEENEYFVPEMLVSACAATSVQSTDPPAGTTPRHPTTSLQQRGN